MNECSHQNTIRDVTPSARGCEECLKAGSKWVHLRLCRTCGHVGCGDDSPNRHATKHFHATGHPIIEGYDPPEGWRWCYVDGVSLTSPIARRPGVVQSHVGRWCLGVHGLTQGAHRKAGATLAFRADPLGKALHQKPNVKSLLHK